MKHARNHKTIRIFFPAYHIQTDTQEFLFFIYLNAWNESIQRGSYQDERGGDRAVGRGKGVIGHVNLIQDSRLNIFQFPYGKEI